MTAIATQILVGKKYIHITAWACGLRSSLQNLVDGNYENVHTNTQGLHWRNWKTNAPAIFFPYHVTDNSLSLLPYSEPEIGPSGNL